MEPIIIVPFSVLSLLILRFTLLRLAGRIFVHADDLVGQKKSLRAGVICEFYLYQDAQGLGAERVVARQVLVSDGRSISMPVNRVDR